MKQHTLVGGIYWCSFLMCLVSCGSNPTLPETETAPIAKVESPSQTENEPSVPVTTTAEKEIPAETKAPAIVPPKKNESPATVKVDPVKTPEPAPVALAGISGKVKVLANNGEVLAPDGVIINLEPLGTRHNLLLRDQPRQHVIDMVNKTYAPGLITVKRNDRVSFVNRDKIKHNVFSSSGENTFDLGTYGSGETQRVALSAPGIVKVYCNIHPEMASFISVSDHNYSFITGKDGKFSIKDLPAGNYTLTAWHIRGELQQTVSLVAGQLNNLDLTIDTSSFKPIPHKNKFGEDYKVTPALFDDEFY